MPPEKKPKKNQKPKWPLNFSARLLTNIGLTLLTLAILSGLYSIFSGTSASTIAMSQLAKDVESGAVTRIVVEGDNLDAFYSAGGDKVSQKEDTESLTQTLTDYGVTPKQLNAIEIDVKNQSGVAYWLETSLPFLIPLLLMLLFLWYLSRQAKGAGMQAFSFGQSKARVTYPHEENQKVLFRDVAGVKEAKEELVEIVDFLRHPKKFLDIGARIPKGVLLMGAPGSGKTLLARAVAGEANVPFFSISGSEFVEMFVGVGASRVRDLFKMAKRAAPAIIFVDEIDAVGRVRGTGVGGGNDEREQTLNQILVEMDGFEPNEKVIVMAATNRPDVLDPALLRPGRFDRRVVLELPDRNDREQILLIHARKKPLGEDVDIRVIAERTPGFSGADLQSLMNEGAILAARENRKKITQYDLIRAIEKVMLVPERKSHILSPHEKKVTAYHEAGHAVVASVVPHGDPVHKISIISRGMAAGYTLKLPLEERRLQSRKEFLDDITISLGGFVAEKMIFNDLTTGPSNDLQVATALARDMVTKYGMSDSMGPMALESAGGRALFGAGVNGDYSEKMAAAIDAEVSKMMHTAEEQAKKILLDNRRLLDTIATRLTEAETIERDEFEKILIVHGITPKRVEEVKLA